jgi:hypothetical protein
MHIMLGGTVTTLPESLRGPFEDFSQKINGADGTEWEGAFKKFLRKEPCWVNGDQLRSVALTEPKSEPKPLLMSITVDADLDPNVPSDLFLTGEGAEHRKMGKITLEKRDDGKLYANGIEVVRYVSPNQQGGKTIQGHKLRKELKDKQVLNACIMDALRANPQLIPEEWKIGCTYFWGTIFRGADDSLSVEYLCWGGVQWFWGYVWLGSGWGGLSPAASLAS